MGVGVWQAAGWAGSAGKVMIDVEERCEEGGNEEEETGRRGCGNKGTKLNTARSDWWKGGVGEEARGGARGKQKKRIMK